MTTYDVTAEQFTQWLRAYQGAWEDRDSAAAPKLFTDGAHYFWTPLVPPQHGPQEIAATWRADFTRPPGQLKVRIEGVLSAEFAAPDQCRVFHEWWHMSESPG